MQGSHTFRLKKTIFWGAYPISRASFLITSPLSKSIKPTIALVSSVLPEPFAPKIIETPLDEKSKFKFLKI